MPASGTLLPGGTKEPPGKRETMSMTVNEASIKTMKAYSYDDLSVVVYVIDATGKTVFTALRDRNKVWKHADVTVNDLNDYSLILDYAEVERLVTEAKKSLSD
jgi:hypothetical protein